MPKMNSDFLKRIKDQVADRVKNRIRRELAPDVNAPAVGDVPQERLDQGLRERITQTVKEKVRKLGPVQERMLDPRAPLDLPTIKYRIEYAGQNRVLLFMRYNNQWRHVEPMSYRLSKKTKKLLFYGWCRIHDETHAFKLEKIQGLIVTDQVFTPHFEPEF